MKCLWAFKIGTYSQLIWPICFKTNVHYLQTYRCQGRALFIFCGRWHGRSRWLEWNGIHFREKRSQISLHCTAMNIISQLLLFPYGSKHSSLNSRSCSPIKPEWVAPSDWLTPVVRHPTCQAIECLNIDILLKQRYVIRCRANTHLPLPGGASNTK